MLVTSFSQQGVWEVKSLKDKKQREDNCYMNDRNILVVFLINEDFGKSSL